MPASSTLEAHVNTYVDACVGACFDFSITTPGVITDMLPLGCQYAGTAAGLDKTGKRRCRRRGFVLVQDETRGAARCADHTEADGYSCMAAWTQQDCPSTVSGTLHIMFNIHRTNLTPMSSGKLM